MLLSEFDDPVSVAAVISGAVVGSVGAVVSMVKLIGLDGLELFPELSEETAVKFVVPSLKGVVGIQVQLPSLFTVVAQT